MRRSRFRYACLVGILTFLTAVARSQAPVDGRPLSLASEVSVMLGLPSATVSPGPAQVRLGERLFFDRHLSSDRSVGCADCHNPGRAFADGHAVSTGVNGRRGDRNAPSLLNGRFLPVLFWDGRSPSLEDQARYPLTGPHEMNMRKDAVVQALSADAAYRTAFAEAFGEATITFDGVCAALAAYQRTLVSGGSSFDRFYFAGEIAAMTPSARRGWDLFRGAAGCIACHRFDDDHRLFSDFEYHNTGVGWDAARPDLGRYLVTRVREDRGRFRTPSLRNVSLTAPYMHDGGLPDLAAVVAYYVRGGITNRYLDDRIRPLDLNETAQADLVAWLRSLEGAHAVTVTSRDVRGKP